MNGYDNISAAEHNSSPGVLIDIKIFSSGYQSSFVSFFGILRNL